MSMWEKKMSGDNKIDLFIEEQHCAHHGELVHHMPKWCTKNSTPKTVKEEEETQKETRLAAK